LFAGTGTFTSCIDNDEPAGIEELRGAKAELLRAKVAVEQAEAALTLAKAETEKALAAKGQAEAKIKEAEARIKEAQAEAQEATTAAEKAIAEARVDSIQKAMAIAALEHEESILSLKGTLAEAQRTYELTLVKIAVAKKLFPLDAQFTLDALETSVTTWTDAVDSLGGVVAEKQAVYDSLATDYKYYGKLDSDSLQLKLDEANAALAAEKATLAKYEGWLEEDVATKDWRAEVDKLTAEIDSLAKYEANVKLDSALAENSTEYRDLLAAQTEAAKPAKADSVYGHKYYGDSYATTLYGEKNVAGSVVTKWSDGQTEVTEEAAKLAQVKAAMDMIAEFDNDGVLKSGNRLYTDKKYLASFTAEVKHFLDTIAATAAADTSLKAKSDEAIKEWKDALAAYSAADTTMQAELDTVYIEQGKWNLVQDKSAKKIDAYRKALLAYLTVAKKNGATLNTIPALQKDSVLVPVGGGNYKKQAAYALEDALVVLADTAKTYEAIYTYGVDFLGVVSKGETPASIKLVGTNGKEGDVKYYKNVIAKAAPTADDLFDALVLASDMAFGDASLYHQTTPNYEHGSKEYLHVQPTEDDVKNIVFFNGYTNAQIHAAVTATTNGIVGAYGKYLIAKDDNVLEYAQNYEAIIENLEAAVEYWEATYNTLKAKYTAWETAKKAADNAVADYKKANIDSTADKLEELSAELGRLNQIKGALQKAINVYLPKALDGSALSYSAAEAFKTTLDGIVTTQKLAVNRAERAVAKAQKAVELNEYDLYSELTEAEIELNDAIAELKDAQAELEKALANIAEALKIYEATVAE